MSVEDNWLIVQLETEGFMAFQVGDGGAVCLNIHSKDEGTGSEKWSNYPH